MKGSGMTEVEVGVVRIGDESRSCVPVSDQTAYSHTGAISDAHLIRTATMSPTLVSSSTTTTDSTAVKLTSSMGPSLIIGSPATAQDGQYQSLIASFGDRKDVERQMFDRVLDGGML
jgi:hypothetical protein